MAKPPEPPEPPPAAPHGSHHLLSQPLTEIHPMALIEPWINFVPQQQRRLGLFICLALAIHAAVCLFLVIDTSVAQMRHTAHLNVSVDNPMALAVNGQPPDQFWDEITDPRVFLLPRGSAADFAADMPPPTTSTPLASGGMPLPAPPETYRQVQPAVVPLEQRILEAMMPPRQPFVYDPTPQATTGRTTWKWDDALAQRHPVGVPDLPTLVSDTNITPTRVRIAISPRGTVDQVLVEPISNDLSAPVAGDMEAQAVDAARKIRFDAVATPGEQWGRLTIFWNYTPKPREEVVPTPPAPAQ